MVYFFASKFIVTIKKQNSSNYFSKDIYSKLTNKQLKIRQQMEFEVELIILLF